MQPRIADYQDYKEYVSNCCGAGLVDNTDDKDTMTGICGECHEGCGMEEEK